MSFRNDEDALRERVARLEGELASAEEKIAELSGAQVAREVSRDVRTSALTGAVSGATLEKTLPFELDVAGYEAIAALVRERLKVEVSQVGGSLTTPGSVFSLKREAGSTTIRVHGDWPGFAGGMISVTALSTIFTTLASVGVLHDLSTHPVTPATMLHALWIGASVALGSGWLSRKRARTQSERQLALYQGTFEAVRTLAEKHAVRAVPPTRVAVEEDDEREEATRAERELTR